MILSMHAIWFCYYCGILATGSITRLVVVSTRVVCALQHGRVKSLCMVAKVQCHTKITLFEVVLTTIQRPQ